MSELRFPDPSVVLLVGAAGAGKSTFAARHFPSSAVLSSDALRATIAGDPADQSVNRQAFAALHRALDRRLAAGLLTVVDATNVTVAARRAIREIAARHGIPIVAVVLDLPPPIVHARNAGRTGRTVPEAAVTHHLGQLRNALANGDLGAEGYAQVVRLRDPAEVDGLTVRLVPPDGAGDG
ncbi:MAG TPA: AAA family ATPase [Candidatus Sulfomarinibacteraceae bacterium]|nr:AAA family ATPase [Candidatus Sulfomarinibacteraceae bacterium]